MLMRRYERRVRSVTIRYRSERLGMWCRIRSRTGRQNSGCGGLRKGTTPETFDKAIPSARVACSKSMNEIRVIRGSHHVAADEFEAAQQRGDYSAADTKHQRSGKPAFDEDVHRQQPRVILPNRGTRGEEREERSTDSSPQHDWKARPAHADPRMDRDDQPAR